MKKLLPGMKRLLLLPVFFTGVLQAQLPAFPGAEGMGKFTRGGRGTATAASTIMVVTNLNDDNLPGCLRYAATATSAIVNRTVIFRVSGTIHLNSKLSLNKPNTTIAGQSAPGDGICIADYPVAISTDNLVVRYIRFRLGDKNQNLGMIDGSGDDDAFSGTGHKNIIIDHCTMSWSDDESFTVYDGDSTTLQWNLISEPLDYSYHFETGDADFEHHGYGGIWGGKNTTAHHNLMANCRGRMPRFSGSRFLGDGATVGLENVDFRNNVIYNWSSYNTNGGEGGNYNIVNNYYKYGPSTPASASTRGMIINPFKTPPLPYGKYYLTGNYVDGSVARTNNNWYGAVMSGGTAADTAEAKVLVPFPLIDIPTEAALDAYNSVLNSAGCSLPNRDTLDDRIINNVKTRTGKIIDVQGGYPHGTPYATTVGAWPTLLSAAPPLDANGDKIPDEWVEQRGLTGVPLSGTGGYHINGYTHLENFLNGDSIVAVGALDNCVAAKQITLTSGGNWVDLKDTGYTRLISTDTNNVVASMLDNANVGDFNASYFVTHTTRYFSLGGSAIQFPYLNRDLVIAPPLTPLLPIPSTVRFYFTAAEYDSLRKADITINSLSDLVVLHSIDPGYDCTDKNVVDNSDVIVPSSFGNYGTYQNGYYLEFESPAGLGKFFIAGKNSTIPLRLLNFTAAVNSGKVITKWTTANEINASNFTIERSADGRNFRPIGLVDAAASTSGTKDYTFTDNAPFNGISYYRLQMTDRSGTYRYSQVVAVSIRSKGDVKVSPNPVSSQLVVSYPKATAGAILQVFSSDGKKVLEPVVTTGSTAALLDVSVFTKGVYMIIFSNEKTSQSIKFTKQ